MTSSVSSKQEKIINLPCSWDCMISIILVGFVLRGVRGCAVGRGSSRM